MSNAARKARKRAGTSLERTPKEATPLSKSLHFAKKNPQDQARELEARGYSEIQMIPVLAAAAMRRGFKMKDLR